MGYSKKKFQKFKCPGVFLWEVGGLKLQFDWYILSETVVYLVLVLCVHYEICRFIFIVSTVLGSVIGCLNVNPSAGLTVL